MDYDKKMAYPTPDLTKKSKLDYKNNQIIASSRHESNIKRYSLLITRPEEKQKSQQRVLSEIIEESHDTPHRNRNDFMNCKSLDHTPVFREYKQSNNLKSSILSGLN